MNTSSNKEIKEILNLFSIEYATPDPYFKNKLKKRFTNRYSNTSLSDFFNIKGWRFITASLLAIFMVVIFGSIEVVNLNKVITQNPTTFSDKQKNDLVENILKNNSVSLLNKNLQQPTHNITNQGNSPNSVIQPNLNDYNYRESKITFKPGQGITLCGSASIFPTIEESIHAYEYFSKELNEYKYISTDKDGNLINYTLGKLDKNTTEIIEYMGGKTAKRIFKSNDTLLDNNINLPLSYPLSFPLSYSQSKTIIPIDPIKQYLKEYSGSDTKVTQLVKENNNEYYILQRQYQIPCSNLIPSSYPLSYNVDMKQTKTLYYQDFVDSKNYTILRSEVYLNEIKSENLVGTIKSTSEKNLIDFSKIANQFNFDYNNVEIITIK